MDLLRLMIVNHLDRKISQTGQLFSQSSQFLEVGRGLQVPIDKAARLAARLIYDDQPVGLMFFVKHQIAGIDFLLEQLAAQVPQVRPVLQPLFGQTFRNIDQPQDFGGVAF